MKSFKVLFPNGTAVTNATKFSVNGVPVSIVNETDLCKMIKRDWCKRTQSKSFTNWAEDLNNDGNFDGTFTKFDALDNLSGMYQINIDGKHVHAYDLFSSFLPFK